MDTCESFRADRWVAIVDDDESIRRALARLLRAHGIDNRTFASAQEYLEGASATAAACIIVDLHLRDGMNGFELSEYLRARGASPPLIFITGQDEHELWFLRAGAPNSTVLRKPFDATLLLGLVSRSVREENGSVAQ
jgi:two-component system, LuxR family, response regulator FixJ